jgi:putative membrane protein
MRMPWGLFLIIFLGYIVSAFSHSLISIYSISSQPSIIPQSSTIPHKFNFFKIIIFTIFPLLSLLYVIAVAIYEYYYYKLYYYNFTDENAEIRKGVISRATGYVRYERLQNIYLDQDFLDRIFGLYNVHYETAGETSGFYSHVDGLTKENAEKLIAFLNLKAKELEKSTKTKSYETQPIEEQSKIPPSQLDISETEYSRDNLPISNSVIVTRSVLFILYILFLIFIFLGVVIVGYSRESDISNYSLYSVLRILFLPFIIVLTIGIFVANYVWYNNFYFKFTKEKGEIRTKVIGQHISYLFYDRIQNVNINQGILGKIFNIYDVTIETAGEMSFLFLIIPGLSEENAKKLRDFLLQKSKFYKGL